MELRKEWNRTETLQTEQNEHIRCFAGCKLFLLELPVQLPCQQQAIKHSHTCIHEPGDAFRRSAGRQVWCMEQASPKFLYLLVITMYLRKDILLAHDNLFQGAYVVIGLRHNNNVEVYLLSSRPARNLTSGLSIHCLRKMINNSSNTR